MSLRSYLVATSAAACLIVPCTVAGLSRSQSLDLPANTMIAVRMIDTVDSDKSSAETDFRASVDDSVVVKGTTIIPVGTPAFLRLVQVEQAGAVKGRAAVSLRLTALEIDGHRVALRTGNATIRSASQGAKATKSGIAGAVAGGLLGGLLGGKAGAAKGAAVGAAVGVTAAAASGQRVRIPAETRMSFRVRPQSSDPLLDVLLGIEEDSNAMQQAGDTKGIEKTLAPEFTLTSRGRQYSRKEFLKLIKPIPNFIEAEIDSPSVRQDGDRAVLSGIVIVRYHQGTGIAVMRQKFISTFIQRDGHWFYLASESDSITAPGPLGLQ